uniref:Movement protein n=1 Tax=Angiostrongylus cantonensis TaxID=6313 RepID=A0A0K0CVS7_ANGCA
LPVMLHRSPSGAKRKIRQRREEQGSRPSPFLPASSSSSNQASPATSIESNYRSLIDSGGYQSILPDFDSSLVPATQPRWALQLSLNK